MSTERLTPKDPPRARVSKLVIAGAFPQCHSFDGCLWGCGPTGRNLSKGNLHKITHPSNFSQYILRRIDPSLGTEGLGTAVIPQSCSPLPSEIKHIQHSLNGGPFSYNHLLTFPSLKNTRAV